MRIGIMAAACAAALAACGVPVMAPEPLQSSAAAPALPTALARALATQGRYAEAVALLEAEAGRHPSAALLGNLGYAYYLDGRLLPALGALERACLLEPGNAVAWERLAALLETVGESGRALEAMRQARTLREAAAALAAAAPAAAAAAAAAAGPWLEPRPGTGPGTGAGAGAGADLWPAGMARVEVRPVGAGLVEVVHIPPPQPGTRRAPRPPRQGALRPAPQIAPQPMPQAAQHGAQHGASAAALPAGGRATMLEVSNGNGVRGMAAAVARRLREEGVQVMRLTNTVPFNVAQTRVEVRSNGEPQLRIVLGHDLAQSRPEIKKPPAVGRRQAP